MRTVRAQSRVIETPLQSASFHDTRQHPSLAGSRQPVCEARYEAGRRAGLEYGAAVPAPHGGYVLRPQPRLLAGGHARPAGGSTARPAVRDPARLRPRLVLQVAPCQQCAWLADRHRDADALRLLAPQPCHPPCDLRQPRPPRHRRRRYPDRARIPVVLEVASARLPPVPPSADHVRRRAGLPLPDPPPHPGGHAPQPAHLPQRRSPPTSRSRS